MANMSYCKFQNTLRDLEDCQRTLETIFEGGGDDVTEPLSDAELRAAKALIQVAFDMVNLVAEQRSIEVSELDEADAIEDIMDDAQGVLEEMEGR